MTQSWPPRQLPSLERQLRALSDSVRQRPPSRDDDEQLWLTRFLLIRAVGYLEQVVHESFRGHIEHSSYGTVKSFSISWFERSVNPSVDNLCTLLGRLDGAMRSEFEGFIDEDDGSKRRELMLAVSRRHQIAHGLNEGMGTERTLQLVDLLIEIGDWFIRTLNPLAAGRPSHQLRGRTP